MSRSIARTRSSCTSRSPANSAARSATARRNPASACRPPRTWPPCSASPRIPCCARSASSATRACSSSAAAAASPSPAPRNAAPSSNAPETSSNSPAPRATSPTRSSPSSSSSPDANRLCRLLLDEREHLEHRHVHRDDNDADHDADADHHDRLDDRSERRYRRVDFVLVEVCDLREHLLELSRLLADLDHLRNHRREDLVLDERLRDRHTFVHP